MGQDERAEMEELAAWLGDRTTGTTDSRQADLTTAAHHPL